MPKLVRFYLRHVAGGFAASCFFVALLLAFDVGGLGRLVGNSDAGWLAVGLLIFMNGVTFAGAQIAFAVLAARRGRQSDDGPR